MDILFPRTFLLVFAQLSVGGLFCLSIPPFHDMDRGYYKSSAFVFWGIGTLATLGHVALWRRPGASEVGGLGGFEIALWCVFCLFSGAYLASLWNEYVILRARFFTAAWLVGVAALVTSAGTFASASELPLAAVVYPTSFVLSALVLGTAGSGMLLGHWYLIDRDLSLTPLWNILRFYGYCLVAQIAFTAAGCAVLVWSGGGHPAFWNDYSWVLLGRLAISPVGTAALALMIRRTLQIPQTMAATGLFYIAILGAIVGELLGRYLLFRTGFPL